LYTFGCGDNSRLGHGNSNDLNIPTRVQNLDNVTQVACGDSHTAVIANGHLYTFGWGADGQLGHGNSNSLNIPTRVQHLDNVTQVACGNYYTAVIANK
jgi:alpha-tubulin suppressor-like RCC1 family protein